MRSSSTIITRMRSGPFMGLVSVVGRARVKHDHAPNPRDSTHLCPPWRGGYSPAWGFNPRWGGGRGKPKSAAHPPGVETHRITHIFARPGRADIHQPGVSTPGGVAGRPLVVCIGGPCPVPPGVETPGYSIPALPGRLPPPHKMCVILWVSTPGGEPRPPPYLGLKPQAGEYPPLQGGQRCV